MIAMIGRRFYHPLRTALLAIVVAIPCAAAQEKAAWEKEMAALPAALPPHKISDITKLLEHYKPDPVKAAQSIALAEAAPPETTDRVVLFDFYLQRGAAAAQVGRVSQQIADLRKAVDEYGDKRSRQYLRALRDLSAAESWGGNLLNGVRRAREAQALIPPRLMGMELGAEQQLVAQNVGLGDFATAREHLRKAEAIFTLLRSRPGWDDFGANWTALIERSRGELFRGEGRFVEAEGALRKALRAIEEEIRITASGRIRPGDDEHVHDRSLSFREMLERSTAAVLLGQGKIAEAEAMARQALHRSLERVGRGATPTAQGLNLLSATIAEQGRYAEAALLAQESLKSYEMAGAATDSVFLANARRALASTHVAQGNYREARAIFTQMRDGIKSNPELLKKVGASDLDWVLALLRTGEQAEAEQMARRMLDWNIHRFGDDAPRTATVRAFYAMTLAARGERDESLRMFRAAAPLLIERSRQDAEAETNTIKRQQRLVIILESYLKLLIDLHPGEDLITGPHAEEAFRLADIARNSAVQRALTASAARANIADPALASLARREQDTQRRISTLSELLTQLLSASPDQQLPAIQARMRQDIEVLRKERDSLRAEIAKRFPDYAELVDPRPASALQVTQSLRTGEALLAFYFGEEFGLAWALRGDGSITLARIPLTRTQLATQVLALRKALDTPVAGIDDIPAFDLGTAYRLYTQLLKPLQTIWGSQSLLLIAPHGELGQLPLSLLPTEPVAPPGKTAIPFAGYRNLPWLARTHAIAQLPSVTSLASLRKLPPGDPARQAFIGFGDPLFSASQASTANGQTLALRSARAIRLRNSPQTLQAESAGLAQLPRLPDTSQEIREIARVLEADLERDVFLQARATVKAVQETDLTRRRVVMFSTHGLVPGDLDGLTQPALAMTSPEVSRDGGDGLLTLDKILSLKLNADWVVLSACNTAAGDGAGSEAVSGLGRAFFFAGTRALLASNWPVETEAARLLMTDLFRRQRAQAGLTKAEALRQAMLALADGPGTINPQTGRTEYSYAHPLFWSPFVVVGD